MNLWGHGYFTAAPYLHQAGRQLAPAWLDFAALVSGHASPRDTDGEPFRYLDLGSGLGTGLCLLAAAHPEGEFLGIDLMPCHVAQGQRLARSLGLANVRFEQADFLDLAAGSAMLTPGFHYVVAHGIASWITPQVREALLTVASTALHCGGLFYCSYNTLPGWLPATVIHELMRLQTREGTPHQGQTAWEHTRATLLDLLGDVSTPLPLASAFPGLHERLDQHRLEHPAYLLHEYGSEAWQPLFVARMHEACEAHKLSYTATATLSELFDDFLAPELRPQVVNEPNPRLRHTLLDLATNKSFRRDLFSKGAPQLEPGEQRGWLESLCFRLAEAPPLAHYAFNTAFGTVVPDQKLFKRLEQRLAQAPASLGELELALGHPLPSLVRALALLLEDGRVGLDRGPAADAALERCQQVNAEVMARQCEGSSLGHLISPRIGNVVGLSGIEAMLLEAHRNAGLSAADTLACTRLAIEGQGISVRDNGGEALTGPALDSWLEERLEALRQQRIPALCSLGVLAHGDAGELAQ